MRDVKRTSVDSRLESDYSTRGLMQVLTGMLLRTFFSLHHAQMAAFHARSAAEIELDESEETAVAISAHVSGAVMCASGFIEATANELTERDGQGNALLRFNAILAAAGAPEFDQEDTTWQGAKTLLDLRNRLVHYKHDWLDSGTKDMVGANNLYGSALYPRLQTAFRFLPATHHYGPRFLSPECAVWAINTATAFLDKFYMRVGQTPNHEHLRHRIEVQRP